MIWVEIECRHQPASTKERCSLCDTNDGMLAVWQRHPIQTFPYRHYTGQHDLKITKHYIWIQRVGNLWCNPLWLEKTRRVFKKCIQNNFQIMEDNHLKKFKWWALMHSPMWSCSIRIEQRVSISCSVAGGGPEPSIWFSNWKTFNTNATKEVQFHHHHHLSSNNLV